jgi:hypothetical protein
MLNKPELLEHLKSSLEKASKATSKKELRQYLSLARSYAGALDHPCSEELQTQINFLDNFKGHLPKIHLKNIQNLCKTIL